MQGLLRAHKGQVAPSSKRGSPSHHFISIWASSGDNLRPRSGDEVAYNQPRAPGADTAKSLDLTAGPTSPIEQPGLDPQVWQKVIPALVTFP